MGNEDTPASSPAADDDTAAQGALGHHEKAASSSAPHQVHSDEETAAVFMAVASALPAARDHAAHLMRLDHLMADDDFADGWVDDVVADAAVRTAERILHHHRAESLLQDRRQHAAVASEGAPLPRVNRLLLAAVEEACRDYQRRLRREQPLPDPFSGVRPPVDFSAQPEEADLVRTAMGELSDNWRRVLMCTVVLDQPMASAARLLDMNLNAVSAASYRAREGLRKEYLRVHLGRPATTDCAGAHRMLPAYVRGTLTPRRQRWLTRHLNECSACRANTIALGAINARMPAYSGSAQHRTTQHRYIVVQLSAAGGPVLFTGPYPSAAKAQEAKRNAQRALAHQRGRVHFTVVNLSSARA